MNMQRTQYVVLVDLSSLDCGGQDLMETKYEYKYVVATCNIYIRRIGVKGQPVWNKASKERTLTRYRSFLLCVIT